MEVTMEVTRGDGGDEGDEGDGGLQNRRRRKRRRRRRRWKRCHHGGTNNEQGKIVLLSQRTMEGRNEQIKQ